MKALLLRALVLPAALALSPLEAHAANMPFESASDLGPTLLAAGAPHAHAIAAQLESESNGVRSLAALAHLNQAELHEVMAELVAGSVNVGERSLVRRLAELDFSMLEFPSEQALRLEAYERDAMKDSRSSLLLYQEHREQILGLEDKEVQLDKSGRVICIAFYRHVRY